MPSQFEAAAPLSLNGPVMPPNGGESGSLMRDFAEPSNEAAKPCAEVQGRSLQCHSHINRGASL
ncbi:MAG: hypothetical protein P4L92_10290 [Rudaea sp.]|nr:hypothetical protein [Rudaea sp.]